MTNTVESIYIKIKGFEKFLGGIAMSSNKRKHTRYDNPKGIFNITTDRKNWHEIGLEDISAGGMKFTTSATFDVDEDIQAILTLRNRIKDDNTLNLQGVIRRRDSLGQGLNSYAVEFSNITAKQLTNLSEIMAFIK